MMLRHMQWFEADLIVKGMEGAIAAKTVTYDFERLMDGALPLKCSEFGDAISRKHVIQFWKVKQERSRRVSALLPS